MVTVTSLVIIKFDLKMVEVNPDNQFHQSNHLLLLYKHTESVRSAFGDKDEHFAPLVDPLRL